MKKWVIGLLALLWVVPAEAQIGAWKWEGILHDNARNIPVAAVVVTELTPDHLWRTAMATNDGTGEWGRTAITEGLWATEIHGDDRILCVRALTSRYTSCFTMIMNGDVLHWSGMDFVPIIQESKDEFFKGAVPDPLLLGE